MRIIQLETLRPRIQPNLLFVRLYTDEGEIGLGEAFFGPQAVEAYLHETAAPVLLKMADVTPEAASVALAPYLGYQGAGAEVRGNAAIDLALWDLIGKQTGLSLSRLLGGGARGSLRVYNTCAGSSYVRTTTRQSSDNWGLSASSERPEYEDLNAFLNHPGRLARELLDEGISGMKIWPFDLAAERTGGNSISRQELSAGLRIVGEIRDTVGTDMDLMIELHGLWNRPTAALIINALEQFQPYWVEDPIRADAADALHHLSQEVNVPLAVGETSVGRRGALPLLKTGSVDVLTLDLQWTGGITEARKVASLADTFGIPIAPHDCTGPATLAACVHLGMSQPNTLIQETVRAFLRTWYRDLVIGLPEVVDGHITDNGRPGHGVEIRPDIVDDDMFVRQVVGVKEFA
ncbi:mandelate racemase/muconate lactonizing enzyme family protein [Arthrobacter sp. MMS18-M83]|uniref:mandelate racemase/muconate lactonizing enzyme family protein n=1 Tax=Arthrobacter sp. MMS18-M83 TaxID=2996261 RepID=UPI00227CF994|nr:mandelate racemase/muconate lactonizing enzyme family protein [Arthrobacter sp. MMS18-M83]WAH99167.1 mandelate racemase/muconate lactonizing enzyme family protein [Arthrobacter sp. MMS18-M83]